MPKAFDDDYRHNLYATHPAHAHQQHHHQQHQQQQQQPTYYLPSQPNAHHYAAPPPQQHLPALPPVHANGNGYTYAMSNGGGGAGPNTSPTTSNSGSVRAGASPYGHGGHSARASPLHRGEACLTCRRRKMKCDAGKPACGPCSRQGKGDECEYEESRFLAQIARLESEVDRLRARVRELEGTASSTSTTSTSSADGAASSDTPTTSPSGADYSAATNGGFTAYLPSSNVRRSPSDGGSVSTGGGGMGPPSVGNGSRPASAYGFYEGARPGTAHGGYSNFSGTNTPYSAGTGTHTPSPPGMTPGSELAGEVFGRM